MNLTLMKTKIHRATITEADLAYEGSITVDASLLREAGILPFEQVHVYDINNSNRFVTYAIEGPAGSGRICVNGAAARLVHPGDLIIIVAYAQMSLDEARGFQPRVLLVDEKNRIRS